MKKLFLIALLVFVSGCFSGANFTPSDSECMYRCSKCGKKVLMMNSVLRSESCPQGGKHQWQYNLK
jgi:hypothetical protein